MLHNLFGKSGKRLHAKAFMPNLEVLEDRCLLSSTGLVAPPSSMMNSIAPHAQANFHSALLPQLPANPTATPTTVPPAPFSQDVNPYGVAFVPQGFATGGPLNPGDILVSNFNDPGNQQGTGRTIARITPGGQTSLFFQGQPGLGLTTALGVLKKGFVIVGNVPTSDGTFNTIQQGSLMILDRFGFPVANLTNAALLNGPWDLTVVDRGNRATVFVSNVLSGTVTRLDLEISKHSVAVESAIQIASGYATHSDPGAVVVGPTGLAYDAQKDILYVASTADNEIFAISHAASRQGDGGKGTLIYQDSAHLAGPLGLALAPKGDLIAVNGDASTVSTNQTKINEMVEFTPQGKFVAEKQINTTADGAGFGLAINVSGNKLTVAAVDDVANALDEWTITL